MNKKDQELISVLKRNARISVSDLARHLNLSRTTVQQRLKKLEESGTIAGYSVRLGDNTKAGQIQAYINLVASPSEGPGVVSQLEKYPQVESLYTVSGKIDFVALLSVNTPTELDQVLDNIAKIKGIKSTETAIILSTKFDRR